MNALDWILKATLGLEGCANGLLHPHFGIGRQQGMVSFDRSGQLIEGVC